MNMKVTRIITTTFSGMAVAALMVPQPAAAEDTKTYPSTMCQPSSGEAAPFFSGTANIDPNSAHFVNCPIVRDTFAASGINYAEIVVNDGSAVSGFEGKVECTLVSLRRNGTVVQSKTVATSDVGRGTAIVLAFGSLSSVSGGNYTISCRIPKRFGQSGFSSISNYRIDEAE